MRYRKNMLIKAILISLFLTPVIGNSYTKPEDEIRYRQSGFMFMRWNMGIIKNMTIKYPETYDRQQVIKSASTIAAISKSGIDTLFNEKSMTGKGWKNTRVKLSFSEQPDKVNELFISLQEESDKLVLAAKSGDLIKIRHQYDQLLTTCKSCHKHYRKK